MTGCDMDWLTFVSKVIEATAWPLAVLILVFKFSDRFRELLGNLTEFNLPGEYRENSKRRCKTQNI
ncbi:Uncharacterised protein [Burkholderia pseudomallei]|nr:Uncharacterised protein [Burkholderia pseudomallei]